MSVVAVKIYENSIVMSADSIIIHGPQDKAPVGKGKIFDVNGMLIGSTGLASEGVYLSLFAENHTPLDSSERAFTEYMAEFCQWKYHTYGSPAEVENSYLIAYKDKCFYVNGYYVGEVNDFFAIGAGSEYAEAALYLGHSPQEAVKAACALCCMVAEPIITKSIPK